MPDQRDHSDPSGHSDAARARPIADLQVSAKTAELLSGLRVSTIGELLALPEIRGGKHELGELKAALESLQLHYAGSFVVGGTPTILGVGTGK